MGKMESQLVISYNQIKLPCQEWIISELLAPGELTNSSGFCQEYGLSLTSWGQNHVAEGNNYKTLKTWRSQAAAYKPSTPTE